MLRKIFHISFILCLFSSTLGAQTSTVDSLKTALALARKDTSKVNLLLDLSSQLFRSQPDSAIDYSMDAIQLAESLGFKKGEGYALKNIGLAHFIKGDYEKVLEYWNKSLQVFEESNDQLGVSNLLSNIGAVYFNQGDDPKALELYLRSLQVSEELGNKLRIATASTNIGAVYFNNPISHDKAKKYYLKALSISEEIGDPAAMGTSIVNLGETYIDTINGNLDSAEMFFHQALKAYDGSGESPAYILNNMGRIEDLRDNYEKALSLHLEAYEEAIKVDSKLEMTQSKIGIGNAYLKLGQESDHPAYRSSAVNYFEQAFEEAQAAGWKPEIQKAAEGLYQLYKDQESFALALQYHEIYESTKEMRQNEGYLNLIAILSAERENEEAKKTLQRKIEDQIRREKLFKNNLLAAGLAALILVGMLFQYYRLRRIRAAERFEAQRQLIMQDKLASLGQITAGIAHEIKNPLNFVTNFAEGSLEFGDELIDVLSDNEEKIPTDQFEIIQELTLDINENSKIIQENGLRADRVVKRMMEQARGDKGEPQKVDINTLIDENLLLAYHGYRANNPGFDVHIEKAFDPSLPLVEVIPQDIGRVILNIFNNACQAMHSKQKKLGNGYQPTFRVETEVDNGSTCIRLLDNGPGIPEKIQEKIFRPFFTTKATGQGNTGLGLSISHDLIVIGHHGELRVNSQLDEFTEFLIRLPIDQPPSILTNAS